MSLYVSVHKIDTSLRRMISHYITETLHLE